MATDGPLLGRWESSDPPSLPVWRQSRETHAHFRFGGCHVIRPRGEVTPTRHTRETPRPMKDVPIRLIKPSAKMTPTGIQHGTGHLWFGRTDVIRPHFRFSGSHVIRPHFWFGRCHVTHRRGQMTLSHHTHETPRPMQVVPTRLINHRAKMAPVGQHTA